MLHKKLSLFEQGQVVALVANGESYRSVSSKIGFHHTTISRTWKKYKFHGSTKRKEGSGKKKTYSPQLARQIRRLILSGKRSTASDVHEKLNVLKINKTSIPTIISILKSFNLHGRINTKKPLFTKRHQKLRLEFARKHRKWKLNNRKKCFFLMSLEFSDLVVMVKNIFGAK